MEYPRKRGIVHDYLFKRSTGIVKPWSIFETVRGSKSFVQRLEILSLLTGHDGCVNTVSWNDKGSLLLSGSDDCFLNIYEPWSEKCLYSLRSGHTANVFSAKFLPCTSDKKIVSCSGDGMIHYNELGNESYYGQHPFRCHAGTTYEVLVTPGDPHTFLTCGEDGTVRQYDLRIKNKCVCNECTEDILVDCSHAVTSMSINPLVPYHIAVGCEDSNVRVFDRRTLGTTAENRSTFVKGKPMRGMFSRLKPEKLRSNRCRVTSLQYSQTGYDLLVSYCADYIYLFTLNEEKPVKLKTHQNEKFSFGTLVEDGEDVDGSANLPPLKRLRLRGDWSDTGPNARPETEQGESSENSLLQRMSEVFTSWLENAFRASLRSASSSGESSQSEDTRPERPRSSNRGRLVLGTQRNTERRSRAMRGSNRSRASSSDSDQPSPRISTPVTETESSFGQRNEIHPQADSTLVSSCGNVAFEDVFEIAESPENSNEPPVTDVLHTDSIQNDDVSNWTRQNADTNPTGDDMEKVPFGNVLPENFKRKESNENNRYHDSSEISGELQDSASSANDPRCPDLNGKHNSKEDNVFVSGLRENESVNRVHTTATLNTDSESNIPLLNEASGINNVSNRDEVLPNSRITRANIKPDTDERGDNNQPDYHDVLDDLEEMEGESFEFRSRSSRSHSLRSSSLLDENTAACRIQQFMRKHKESKSESPIGHNVKLLKAAKCYKGHRNARTMIKEANFWGDHFVISGSDCGRIFIWNRHTAELVTFMSGDRHVVNCVQPHPFDPVLASSGIDYDIKLWAPVLYEPNELADIDEVIRRNEQMLEESRDTITVPASFMLRMIASLSHVRGRRRQHHDQPDSYESDDT